MNLPPAAQVDQRVGEVAYFAGFLMGAGPAMLLEEYGLTRHSRQPGEGVVS